MKFRPIVMVVAAMCMAGAATEVSARNKKKDQEIVRPSQILTDAPDEAWRSLDPENIIYMDLPTGRVVIELRSDFAPRHVERIRGLVREGFYNGLHFHRVIEGFMAQGGDPNEDGTGGSDKPDLDEEFARDTTEVDNFTVVGRDRIAARVGFVDGMPVAAQPELLRVFRLDRKVKVWGTHCPGVMSMARATNPNSANSQFFLMIGDSRLNLDKRYTTWGWIVDGFKHSRRIERGEPPVRPTPIVRVRIMADVPEDERSDIQVMRTDSAEFMEFLTASGQVRDGLVRDFCGIKVPVRVDGELRL